MTPARITQWTQGTRICSLLVSIGLPRAEVYANDMSHDRYRASFWKREEHRLLEWLDRAHGAYRKRMRSLHPDRNGNNESATRLNLDWSRIKYLFKQHGVTL